MTKQSLAIIGAGPFGLSATAHLAAAGLEPLLFGEAMEFWRSRMPRGMLLRSAWYASSISDPSGARRLESYEQTLGLQISLPIPVQDYVEYGMWFKDQSIPSIQRRRVKRVEHNGSRFRVILDDTESLDVDRVIVAAGIEPFAYIPPIFNSGQISEKLATHSFQHRDFARFADREVIVVGAGQSALEGAALLSEAGAVVELLARKPAINWLTGRARLARDLSKPHRLFRCRSDVGPPLLTHIVSRPAVLKRFPFKLRDWMVRRAIRPAGAEWLRTRLKQVCITTGRHVLAAEKLNGKLKLTLSDETVRTVDHAILATGYRVDISRYRFLAPELLAAVRRVQGYPVLGTGFESSVPGLHFLGAPGAWSFGPLMRFVSGTEYSSRALTNYILGGSRVG